ncbi:hypothetical protein VNO77_36177 [Canavalia gladiata]|uniref:Uncharacterized protein n=1 Tax=Canavalia gladiata TaxID=3824 RepID=A0AAN9K7K6_CANGL
MCKNVTLNFIQRRLASSNVKKQMKRIDVVSFKRLVYSQLQIMYDLDLGILACGIEYIFTSAVALHYYTLKV